MSDDYVGPTPERLRQAGGAVEDISPDKSLHHRAMRMLDNHTLEGLASRGRITGGQYQAGAQFYADWYDGGLAASGVIDPGRVVVDGGKRHEDSDRRLDALTRHKRAIQAVGIIHSHVLVSVVLLQESLESYGQRYCHQQAVKLAKVAATAVLVAALAELDNHYHGRRHGRIRTACADGYRPTIQPLDGGYSK